MGIFAFGAIQPLGRSIDSTMLTNDIVCIRGTCHIGDCIDSTGHTGRSSCRWLGMARFLVDFPCGALAILVAVHDGFTPHTFLQVVSCLATRIAKVHDMVFVARYLTSLQMLEPDRFLLVLVFTVAWCS